MNELLKETFVFRPEGFIGKRGTVIQPGDYQHSDKPLLRYADGKWIPDDGEYDLAFVQGVMAYYVELPYYTNHIHSWHDMELTKKYLQDYLKKHANGWHTVTDNNLDTDDFEWAEREAHQNYIAGRSAMDKSCEMNGCANGNSISLTGDFWGNKDKPTIYVLRTMQPVKFPENPVCHKCLNNGKGHVLEAMTVYKCQLESDMEYAEKDKAKAEITIYDSESIIEDAKEELEKLEKALREVETK